jgi:uncharacterized protein
VIAGPPCSPCRVELSSLRRDGFEYPVHRLDNRKVSFPDEGPDPRAVPITSLDIDPTEACNLRCSYCFKGVLTGRRMSLETAKQTVRWLVRYSRDAKQVHIALMGGEPLLSFKMLQTWVPFAHNYCRQRGKKLSLGVTTNGTVFGAQHHRFFRFWHIGIHLSIDGLPEVQDRERVFASGRGSSSKLEANIPRLLSAWPVAHARSTVVPETVERLAASYAYFCEKGFLKVAFALEAASQWDRECTIATLEDQYRKVLEYHWAHMWRNNRYYVLTTLDEYIRALQQPREQWGQTICGAGRGMLHVDVDGLLWPCHRFNSSIGPHENLLLGSVWGGFNNRVRDCLVGIRPKHDMRVPCGECEAHGFCRTPCVAANWQSNKDIYDAGTNFCRATRVLYRVHCEHIERMQREQPDRWKQYVDWVLNYRW